MQLYQEEYKILRLLKKQPKLVSEIQKWKTGVPKEELGCVLENLQKGGFISIEYRSSVPYPRPESLCTLTRVGRSVLALRTKEKFFEIIQILTVLATVGPLVAAFHRFFPERF